MKRIIRAMGASAEVVADERVLQRDGETALPQADYGPMTPFIETYARIGLAPFQERAYAQEGVWE